MDRRAVFFMLAAAVCAVLILPSPEDLRWVAESLSVVYVVLAIASFLDYLSLHKERRRDNDADTASDQPNRPVM
jgi:hypothetical protein